MERAGKADLRVPRNYAQSYDSASDEDVDVAGASAKRTRIEDSVVESFHVYAEGQAVDPTATQVDKITSAEQTNALIESYLATPPMFTASTTSTDVFKFPATNLTQNVLQLACKCVGVSCSGAKATLICWLCCAGHTLPSEIRRLADKFEETQACLSQIGGNYTLKQREAKWSKLETACLCHVVSDPRNSTVLSRLYNRAESRAEIDQGRHDP
jgi:hypothetical protein